MARLGRPSNDTEANKAFGVGGHHGTDWGWGQGDGVCAMAAGTVVEVRNDPGYGLLVKIDHGGLIAASTMTRYCHLASIKPRIVVGYRIARGEDLGVMGSTGNLTTQKHLHSELWLNNVRADEQPYQKEADVVLPADWRTVGADFVKRRSEAHKPAAGEPDNISAPPLEPNLNYQITGWRYDTDPTVFISSPTCPAGTNVWFDINGAFSHSSGFTSQSTAGIPDKNPIVPPPVTGGVTEEQVAAIVLASEKRVLAALDLSEKRIIAAILKVPTAEQNGAAARKAIVAPG